VYLTSDATAATNFKLGTDGQIQSSDGVYGWTTKSESPYYLLDTTELNRSRYQTNKVICSIASPAPAGVTGAIGTLSCQNVGSQVYLVTDTHFSDLLFQTTTPDYRVKVVTVAVVPVGSCA
jgi:hypothetical protein